MHTTAHKFHALRARAAPPTLFQQDGTLEEMDPEVAGIVSKEKARQVGGESSDVCV